MSKHINKEMIRLISKKALAAALAAASCLYMSAMPAASAFADEVPPEVAGEEDKEEKSVKESAAEAPVTEPKKKSEEKAEEKTEDNTQTETEKETEKEPEKAPEEKPEEPEQTEQAEDPAPSDSSSETTEETAPETPSDTPSETPAEEPSEAPSDVPSETPSEEPADVPEDDSAKADPEGAYETKYTLSGTTYIQTLKNRNGTFSNGILTLGKQGKRLEAFSIKLKNDTGYAGSLSYRAYVKNKGWTKWTDAGKTVGTKKKNLRIEAVQIKLTGELAKHYSVEYKASLSSLGDDQGWVQNGALAGALYNTKRIEELQVRLVPVGENNDSSVIYRVRGSSYGWQNFWGRDGKAAGVFSNRIEAVSISLGTTKYQGGVMYRSTVQGIGWTDWVSNGTMSGSKKTGKRIEALQIKLTGDMAEHYDIYYRVYAQNYGWLNWAENGQTVGTSNMFSRLEKIQIVLREKDSGEPGDFEGIVSAQPHAYYAALNTNAIMTYKDILGAGYSDPEVFRKKLIMNFEYMDGVGYFHMGKMAQGYTDCAGSVSLAFRVALGTAKFTKKYKKGTLSNGKQLYAIGINYCGIKSYKDKYGWCRNGTASVNSHFLNTIVKNRKIKYTQVSLDDRNDGEHGWTNEEWIDYLNEVGAKPGDVFVWFNHDWSKTKGQHMTMYAGIGEDGIAYEWTASSTYGVILSPLWDRTPQKVFESFTLMKGVADVVGYN